MEGNNYGGNGSSSSTLGRLLAGARRRLDDVAAAATQLIAGDSSTTSTPALLLPGSQSSSSSELASQVHGLQGQFRGENVDAFTAVGYTSTLVSNSVGAIKASFPVWPEMESSVQGGDNSFRISHEQLREQTNWASQQSERARRAKFRERVRPILAAFRAYAVHMHTFKINPGDDLSKLIRAAIQVHLKSHKYQQPLSPTEAPVGDKQCGICLGEYVDGEDIAQLDFCIHVFHYNCIRHWLLLKNCCPVCVRAALKINPNDPLKMNSQ